jgi:hypothetical protein
MCLSSNFNLYSHRFHIKCLLKVGVAALLRLSKSWKMPRYWRHYLEHKKIALMRHVMRQNWSLVGFQSPIIGLLTKILRAQEHVEYAEIISCHVHSNLGHYICCIIRYSDAFSVLSCASSMILTCSSSLCSGLCEHAIRIIKGFFNLKVLRRERKAACSPYGAVLLRWLFHQRTRRRRRKILPLAFSSSTPRATMSSTQAQVPSSSPLNLLSC